MLKLKLQYFASFLIWLLHDLISNFSPYVSMLIYRWNQSLWIYNCQIDLISKLVNIGHHSSTATSSPSPSNIKTENFQEERFQLYTNAFGPLLEKTSKRVYFRPNKQSKMERAVKTTQSGRFSLDSERIYPKRYLAPWTDNQMSLRSRRNTKIIWHSHSNRYTNAPCSKIVTSHRWRRSGHHKKRFNKPNLIQNYIRIITKFYTYSSPGNQSFNIQ